ncbi:hypothetical protein N7499_011053 [Penicillium canescens]|nr:hypothetical protein N7499_011053 [Penicillium canescens]KAJ6182784.1 hypothetical protein N7485_001426 [Penicillium canescens]
MAEAHVNTLFGATGFLGQLIQNTLSAFELWDKVGKATESADRYIVQLQFLRARLHWWTVCWGLLDDETSPSVVADPRIEIYRTPVANYLQLILETLRGLTACEDTASIFKSTYTANASSSLGRLATLLNPLSILQSKGPTKDVKDDASTLRERLEWALQNGRAMEHLKMLSDLIQDLERFLPVPDSNLNGTVLVNPALSASVWKLRWLSRQPEFDVFTTSLAELKATSLSQVNEFKLSPLDKSSRLIGNLKQPGIIRAVLYLHAVEWLHKGIRSSNVVFVTTQGLPDKPHRHDKPQFFAESGLPFLVGFEYSRINSREEGTEKTIDTSDNNLYRHPDTQSEPSTDPNSYLGDKGRFSKNHDIYSLGVILVELGVLRPAQKLESDLINSNKASENTKHGDRPQMFKQHLISLVPEVENRMGAIYANVTSLCLTANFYRQDVTVDQEGAVAFYRDIIAQLGKCKV